jgi:hypothetical protein
MPGHDLQTIGETVARIDERTKLMARNHEREIRGVHTRISEVKADLEKGMADSERRSCSKIEGRGAKGGATAGGALAITIAILWDWLRGGH